MNVLKAWGGSWGSRAVVAAGTFLLGGIDRALASPMSENLSDLKNLTVLVATANVEESRVAIDRDRIKALAELRLRREDIPVVEQEIADEATGYLGIGVEFVRVVVEGKQVGVAFHILIDVAGGARFANGREGSVTLWVKGKIATATLAEVEPTIARIVEGRMVELANDWLAAHPTRR